jgi:hypothetical protein
MGNGTLCSTVVLCYDDRVDTSIALVATGLIWTRYSTVIIPKNWPLFAVNVFVAGTGLMQVCRIMK